MTIERPMFPPRENPFRIVGGTDASGSEKPIRRRGRVIDDEPEVPNLKNDWRSPEGVKRQIAKHVAAREAYASAVAWTIAAEAQNLPLANIEQAHLNSFKLDQEMQRPRAVW